MSTEEVAGASSGRSTLSLHTTKRATIAAREYHKFVVEWNQSYRDYSRDLAVHQRFEKQVRQTPDADAVEFANDTLVDLHFNARANQLARHPRTRGITAETPVGIDVDRSFEMIAFLKADAADVPLGPQRADQRLSLDLGLFSNLHVLEAV